MGGELVFEPADLLRELGDDGDTMFGLCDLDMGFPELGSVSLSEITAVKEGRIEALDEDLASRWGPRLPEFFRSIAAVLSDAGVPAAAAN